MRSYAANSPLRVTTPQSLKKERHGDQALAAHLKILDYSCFLVGKIPLENPNGDESAIIR